MAVENKEGSKKLISENDRFRFIGFEVFPGKPKDLFKSEAEKEKLVQAVKDKRSKGEVIREQCTLLEERVGGSDRLVLTIASVAIMLSLFLPWYSVFNEVAEETKAPAATMNQPMEAAPAVTSDSLAAGLTAEGQAVETPPAVTETAPSEEIIHGYVAKKKVHRDYARASGFGGLVALGTVGGHLFSSGFALLLTTVIFLAYTLLCVALPLYNFYGLFGLKKGDNDERALRLKEIIKYNWIPVVLFAAALILSFLGGEYSFNSAATFSGLGDSYGPGVFMSSLSWGIIISLGGFILIGAKSVEI